MADSRAKPGKAQIESKNQGDPHFPWKPEVWNAAIAAWHAGIRMPRPRLYIVISSDSPVDCPEKLQKLADLPSIPEVIETNEAHEFPTSTGDAVRVCGILWGEFERLKDRTELEREILVWMPSRSTGELEMRTTYTVTSVKEENSIPGDVDEEKVKRHLGELS